MPDNAKAKDGATEMTPARRSTSELTGSSQQNCEQSASLVIKITD